VVIGGNDNGGDGGNDNIRKSVVHLEARMNIKKFRVNNHRNDTVYRTSRTDDITVGANGLMIGQSIRRTVPTV